MSGFEDVKGHEEIITHLQNAIRFHKVSHSYIFSGEHGSGKKLLAALFAMTLQCEEQGIDPCLKCSSCKRALSKNHPDIIGVTHEKPNSIGIDEIRAQVVDDVAIKPYYGPYKIYIINDAHKLTVQAQNALLKTIEEPPAYAVLLLLTDNLEILLPTIRSRCVTLSLKPLANNMVKDYLMDRLQIPDYQAEVTASFSQGNIGKAKDSVTSETFSRTMGNALALLKRSGELQIYELVSAIKEMTAEKENASEYLDIFTTWFRDILLFKATREVDGLVFKKEINDIRIRAQKSSYEGLQIIIDAIDTAKTRLRANVSFELTMELLFLTIREN